IDGKYPLVIVLEGNPSIKSTTSFAVVQSSGTSINPADGGSYASVVVLEGNEEPVRLYGDKLKGIAQGDVIVYSLDGEGLVDEVYTLFSAGDDVSFAGILGESENASDADSNYADDAKYITYFDKGLFDLPSTWTDDEEEDYANFGFGVIVDNSDDVLTVGKVEKSGDK
ncbi:MAG: hypothetical protein IJ401_06825, partial [Oscillospiraceae bacterium]|nr:hypothetical protein [Oscillospiraceae bacterium]